jgi:hypothetical protein
VLGICFTQLGNGIFNLAIKVFHSFVNDN